MKKLIYEPAGRAREYSPLALNVYSGCDHQCIYCYVHNLQPDFSRYVTPRDLAGLEKEAAAADRQILLCFASDPYHAANDKIKNTRKALMILNANRCSVAILSKGGTRCLQDMDIFCAWRGHLKVGATLTFIDPSKSIKYEPGAASPEDRLEALKRLHAAGVRTWASIEPVIEASESLEIIRASIPYVDEYKVGKLSHQPSQVDWRRFCTEAVRIIREAGKSLYVKKDLALYMPPGFLTEKETKCEAIYLPNRKANTEEQIMLPGM